jgi:hypothetical protein
LVSVWVTNVSSPDKNVLVIERGNKLGIGDDVFDKLFMVLVLGADKDDTHETKVVLGLL